MNQTEKGTKEVMFEIKDMCKNFGSVTALNHVSFSVYRGEIRGLIGENGSGKSTVSSIMAGIQPATSGKMFYKGKEFLPSDTLMAQKAGIGMVVQEAGTVSNISVAENFFLGRENEFKKWGMINKGMMIEEAMRALENIGIKDINPALPIDVLDMQDRKLIEVAKCYHQNPEIFIVDETTTALSQRGRKIVYDLMKKIAYENKAVLFISHDLEELMEVCTNLTILRDGDIIRHFEKEEFDEETIKSNMVGRELTGNYYRTDFDSYDEKDIVLKVERVTTAKALMNFSLELHKGEILGIGGLSHCGMHELGRAIYGIDKLLTGSVTRSGVKKITNPRQAMTAGLGYVSKNRDLESIILGASIADNIASAGFEKNSIFRFFISSRKEKKYIKEQITSLRIKCAYPGQYVKYLSGGNKQKVVFGKWVGRGSDILILDCPTRGVDIGVKQAMYQLMYDMKKAGKSIIMISEELPELIGMSDRLIIMKDGKQTAELHRSNHITESDTIAYMV